MLDFIVTFIVIALSLLVAIRVSIGLDVDNTQSALLAAFIVGLLNAALRPLLGAADFQLTFWNAGLLAFLLNIFVLYIAAAFVKGFYVRNFMASIVGSIFLSLLSALIYLILAYFR